MAESGLMRKTKAQLVDIILRKDEVEKKLRQDIDSLNESAVQICTLVGKCEEFEETVKNITEVRNTLEADVQERDNIIARQAKLIEETQEDLTSIRDEYDDIITRNCELAKELRDANNDNKILATVTVVAILVAVIAMFV